MSSTPSTPTGSSEIPTDDTSWEDDNDNSVDEIAIMDHPDSTVAPDGVQPKASITLKKVIPKSTSGRSSPTVSQSSVTSSKKLTSPRRQTVRRRVVIPVSPPRSRTTPSRSTPLPPSNTQRPAVVDTLSYLLIPLRLLLAPLQALLSPFFFHLANGLLIALLATLAAYLLLPRIPSFLLSLTGKALRLLSRNVFSFDFASSDISLGSDAVLLPLRTLATPACALTGLMCSLSLLTSASSNAGNQTENYIVAKPFWRWGGEKNRNGVDVGSVARALTKEVRGARDIFDSVRMLGEGNLAGGLEYVRVWELGVAVLTGSSLDDRAIVGQKLIELGDLTRDLSDEIVNIDSQSVNAFSWLQWEFSRLVQLLSLPPDERPESAVLSRKLHSLLVRLSNTLDTLHHLTSQSVQHASQASSHGSTLLEHLHGIRYSLEAERDRSPIWKRVYDKSTHLVVGGEPTKTELIERDLSLARDTIGNLGDLRWRLEDTRGKVKAFRDQIGMFDASMMGFHLGFNSDDEEGLGPEEEVRILASVVEELGTAVKGAKEGRGREEKSGVLEIEG